MQKMTQLWQMLVGENKEFDATLGKSGQNTKKKLVQSNNNRNASYYENKLMK